MRKPHSDAPSVDVSTEIDAKDEELRRHLVSFSMPDDPTPEEIAVTRDIVRIDHRSLHTLPPRSQERGEIRDLLLNVIGFLQSRQVDAARALLDHVDAVYSQHIQTRNRLRYLGGMLAGVCTMLVFGFILLRVPTVLGIAIPPQVLPLILLFAGMGAITSVLTRLSSIDLRDQTSIWMVVISGMARPVTAVFLALVVDLVFAMRIVDVHVGIESSGTVPPSLLLVMAFLCGFSERFAQDVLARVGGDAGAAHGPTPDSPEVSRSGGSRHSESGHRSRTP